MFDLTNPIYSDTNAARLHLEALHWPNGPVCPRCGEDSRDARAGDVAPGQRAWHGSGVNESHPLQYGHGAALQV